MQTDEGNMTGFWKCPSCGWTNSNSHSECNGCGNRTGRPTELDARLAEATKLLETGRIGFVNRLDEATWLASVSAWLHNAPALGQERTEEPTVGGSHD